MATTVKSTDLDFFEIKDNLKLFLAQKEEFADYDFEGSALSNLLDVLAHNTHFHALISNFTLNEAYLTTAQLRNSVVSLAESLGYIPSSRTSAQSSVKVTINLTGQDTAQLESQYSILPGELALRGSVDEESFNFYNRETLIAERQSEGIYKVRPFSDENADTIVVYQGLEQTIQYPVDGSPNAVYVIPDDDVDISTAIVKIYDTLSEAKSSSAAYKSYTNVFDATTIEGASRLYILRESPNRFFELTFGDNNSLGETPVAGNVVEINYLRSRGSDANGVGTLSSRGGILFGNREVLGTEVNAVVMTRSAGGDDREGIESIRKRAPFQYAAQNRMLTSLDFEALILRKYGNYIQDIISWGGEDDYRKDFGSVYTSILWKENLSSTSITDLRNKIRELVRDLSSVSFRIKFSEPTETWLSTEVYYQYNPSFSALSESTVSRNVKGVVQKYFDDNTGQFQQTFRRSNLLTLVDDADPSILSSRANVKMQKRILPILTLQENHDLVFPTAIKKPTDTESPVIKSTLFRMNNKSVYIRNKLTDRVKVSPEGQVPAVFERRPSTKLEAVDTEGNVVVSNIGYYEPDAGVVHIEALTVQSILSSKQFIKVFAAPANESAIDSLFNNIIEYDSTESLVKAVIVTSKV
jgi:hypothetical protein